VFEHGLARSAFVPVGLLDTAGGGGGLASGLGGELLPGSLSSGGLACSLLGSGHFEYCRCVCVAVCRVRVLP